MSRNTLDIPVESCIVGRSNIAKVFRKRSECAFFARHGQELRDLGITFYVTVGSARTGSNNRASRVMLAAFHSELVRWAAFKGKRGEVI